MTKRWQSLYRTTIPQRDQDLLLKNEVIWKPRAQLSRRASAAVDFLRIDASLGLWSVLYGQIGPSISKLLHNVVNRGKPW